MVKDTKSTKITDSCHRRALRIAKREQRSLLTVLDRAVQLYDETQRRAAAAGHPNFDPLA